jgi:hypothetical protein
MLAVHTASLTLINTVLEDISRGWPVPSTTYELGSQPRNLPWLQMASAQVTKNLGRTAAGVTDYELRHCAGFVANLTTPSREPILAARGSKPTVCYS